MLWLSLLKKYWKFFAGLLLVLVIASSSFYYGRSSAKPLTQTIIKTRVVEKVVTVEKKNTTVDDHKVTVIDKKPDGETITTIKDDKDTKINDTTKTTDDKKTKTEEKVTETPVSSGQTNYSLGLNWYPHYLSIETKDEYEINLGYRALGPVWLDGLYNIQTHQIGVGLRVEF